ncbi:hypothetical protein TrRE_jg524 [Triparma retinervis]|uniref:Uncharacterized protein n=1 Tax=Triparma retinervis TaxID=2557542 RepID=A0A9W7G005_9STRA|nr:hypothetical protein TrRE_jg524 [Triparma retinervis]
MYSEDYSTIFNSSSDSFSGKLHPLTILESPVPDPAGLSTFIPQLLTNSYPVGGQGENYISSNPKFSHTLYRYLVSSDPKVKSLLLSTINNNLLAHREELITIALEYGCSQEQARELIENIILDINPQTSKIVTYSAPDTPFNENVADRRGHKDDSSWRSVFPDTTRTPKIVRRAVTKFAGGAFVLFGCEGDTVRVGQPVVPLLKVGPCPQGKILTIIGGERTTNKPKKGKKNETKLHYGHGAGFLGVLTLDSTTSFVVETSMSLNTSNGELVLALSPLLDSSLNIATLFTTPEGQAALLEAYSSTSNKIERLCTEMASDTISASYRETLANLVLILGDEVKAKAFLAGLGQKPFPPAPPTSWDANTVALSVALGPLREDKQRNKLWHW